MSEKYDFCCCLKIHTNMTQAKQTKATKKSARSFVWFCLLS